MDPPRRNWSSPRQITVGEEGAQTILHEVRAHRRGTIARRHSRERLRADSDTRSRAGSIDPRGGPALLPSRSECPDLKQHTSSVDVNVPRRRIGYHATPDSESESESDSDIGSRHLSIRKHDSRRQRSTSRSSKPSSSSSTSSSARRRHQSQLIPYEDRRSLELARRDASYGPLSRRDRSRSNLSSDEDDEDAHASSDNFRSLNNHAMLYTGLAALTTITAANGLYQNGKGFRDRRQMHKDSSAAHRGLSAEEEAERRKARKTKMAWDVFSLGVCAVGINNVRIGWQRSAEHRKNLHEAEKRAYERAQRRREREWAREGSYSVEEP